ncbi:MAG: hypothetical protein WCK65_03285 [Rhodospirillaceae bacterium]
MDIGSVPANIQKHWDMVAGVTDGEMARFITSQQYDTITYEGKTSALAVSPLECHPDRQIRDRLKSIVRRTPQLRRGYIGNWVVDDNKVFLTGIEVQAAPVSRYSRRKSRLEPLPLDQIFPDAASPINSGPINSGPVHATWINGVLVIGEARGLLERLRGRTSFTPESIIAVHAGVIEQVLIFRTIPTVSAIGYTMRITAKRLLSKLLGGIPSKLTKLKLRWRGAAQS